MLHYSPSEFRHSPRIMQFRYGRTRRNTRYFLPAPAEVPDKQLACRAECICADGKRIRSHLLVPSGIPVDGYIVRSGLLQEVPEATRIGKAS